MKKPIIGITLDSEESGQYSKFPWYVIRKNYLFSIEKFGGIPFPLFHSLASLPDIFSMVDGIIITGGNFDIDPTLYGENHDHSRSLKNTRTNFEMKICEMSLKKNLPILGICGGEQLLNICFGGTLIQDIKKYNKKLNNLALVHCAAYKEDQLAINTDLKNWNKTIDINLTGSFLITREILKLMIKNNYGRIIFFSSSGALQGARGTSSYAASKAGIVGLSKVISKEYAQFNITSNVLNLGAFDTGLYKKLNESLKKKILSTIPSKKLGRLNNISNSIKFLIESEFVNGAVIDVNGGA